MKSLFKKVYIRIKVFLFQKFKKIANKHNFFQINNKNTFDLHNRSEFYNYIAYKYSDIIHKELEPSLTQDKSDKVFVLWLQGLENAPPLIKACVESVKNKLPNKQIIVLTEETIKDYVKFPTHIEQKRQQGIISHAHYSDLIRLSLMCDYGGIWCDATVFMSATPLSIMTGDIPLFFFKQIDLSRHDITPTICSSWYISAWSNQRILLLTRKILYKYWENHDNIGNYFLFHIVLANCARRYQNDWDAIPTFNNHSPHILQFEFATEFNESRWEQIKNISQIHKLNHHINYNLYENNYYRYIYSSEVIQKNKIVFSNFFGNNYGDNPRAICDELLNRNLDLDLVWIVNDNSYDLPQKVRKVSIYSNEAWIELQTAKMWIFNIRNFSHPPKKNKQIYLQTWHGGYPLKLIEKQTEATLESSYINVAKEDGQICDAIISSSSFFTNILKESFYLNKNVEILEYGVPKNDILFTDNGNEIGDKIKRIYNIPNDTKVILYAPTFRNDRSCKNYNINYEMVINALEKEKNEDCVFFVRLHPILVNGSIHIEYSDKVINVSNYSEISDLFFAADYLITDYSGVMVAYSFLQKPVFLYATDYEEYRSSERELNSLFDLLPFSISKTTEELIDKILSLDLENYRKELADFFYKLNTKDDGQASKKVADWILNKMEIK